MTHTKQFLMGMFAAYMGCEVMDIRKNRIGKVVSINKIRVWYEHENSNVVKSIVQHFAFYAELKPILTPLSEITDSDAVEVAKIMEIPQFERAKLFGCDENNYYTIGRHIKNEIIETCYNDGFYLQGAVIDYLRSKHYDCGYMHIPSLISADLAISSKQI